MSVIKEHDIVLTQVPVFADVIGERQRVTIPRHITGTVIQVMRRDGYDDACLVEFAIDGAMAIAAVSSNQVATHPPQTIKRLP